MGRKRLLTEDNGGGVKQGGHSDTVQLVAVETWSEETVLAVYACSAI